MTSQTRPPPTLQRDGFHDVRTGFEGWRLRIPSRRGIPTPAVMSERVFFGAGFGSHEVFAVDARTGDMAWQLHTRDDGPTAAVAFDGFVAFNTESCTLEVVDAERGSVVWERWLGDPLLAQPALAGDRVLMVYPRAGQHFLGAFDLASGRPLWETRIAHDVITAPIYAEGRAYFTTFDGSVWCADPATGTIVWRQELRATSAPWVHRGEVFVSQRARGGTRARPEKGAARTASESPAEGGLEEGPVEQTVVRDAVVGDLVAEYSAKIATYLSDAWGAERKRAFLHEDAAVGFGTAPAAAKLDRVMSLIGESRVSRTWRFQGSRPVVADGVLYETTGDRLEARDITTRSLLWSWAEARTEAGERRLTPPAVSNGRVLAGTWDGRIISWNAATGAVRWEVLTDAPCHWQPVMSGGWVYAGLEDGSLIAFDTGDAEMDGWTMWGGGPGHNG